MNKPILFIGGPKDGERVIVNCDGDMSIHFEVVTDKAEPIDILLNTHEQLIRLTTYLPFSLRGEKEIHKVYVHQGMTGDQAIQHLIERYKR